MASESEIRPLTSPRIFLVGMAAFLIIAGFVVLILLKQIKTAFDANPGLNGFIIGVLLLGAFFTFRQVIRLFREIGWVNSLSGARPWRSNRGPRLLGPMATLLNAGVGARGLSTTTTRAILDSVGTRLDEGRELNRYLIGLLVFLGLLGTFWGLLETVRSIGGVINAMQTNTDAGVMFDDLKSGLSKPIAGMSISFTSSLFGLAGSLILGFL
ncbi:MAG TPA: flagellar motor protein MotA, partial [Roseiarcus sp.]|nr:flagellar motor protein MotA [Roseiarcus sp.]